MQSNTAVTNSMLENFAFVKYVSLRHMVLSRVMDAKVTGHRKRAY